jgi:hypothetical protein
MSPKYCAFFSYTAPGDPAARNGASSSNMTWRISIPLQDGIYPNKARTCKYAVSSFLSFLLTRSVLFNQSSELSPQSKLIQSS